MNNALKELGDVDNWANHLISDVDQVANHVSQIISHQRGKQVQQQQVEEQPSS
ncbi:GCN5-like protein 1 (GCN5L1) [compost metagenome]